MLLLVQIVFIANVSFVLYVLFGYPLLLAVLSRRVSRPIRKDPGFRRTVSILLPVRNGAGWVREKLECILELDYPPELREIIVVSDGSDDGTDLAVREFAPRGVTFFRIEKSGKAAALNFAMQQAHGELLFFTDVRQRLEASSLRQLVACFADPAIGVASGELFIVDAGGNEETKVGLYWKYEKWIRKRLSAIDSILGATGCIYAMRRELAAPLPPHTLLDDMYLPLLAFFGGYRVILDDTARAFDQPTTLATEFRRKVRTLAGNYQILRWFPALLGPCNRMWFHYVSHKLARLLLPYALLLIAAGSFALPRPWALGVWTGQAVFYGLALFDPWIPQAWFLKRISSPIKVFVVLLAAALCAGSILFRPHADYWKPTHVAPKTGL